VKRIEKTRFLQLISIFFSANLLIFIAIAILDIRYGIAFIIWNGIFVVTMIAQFWAFAAKIYSVSAGQRLFVVIALGATVGSWVGSIIARELFPILNSEGMMLLATVLLTTLYFLPPIAVRTIPENIRDLHIEKASTCETSSYFPGGFDVVFSSRYLTTIALFVIGLNVITSTSDFILASLVTERAADFASAEGLSKEAWIGSFYGDLYFWVNLGGLLIQIFLVSRLFQVIGVMGALLVTPLVVITLFGLLIFVPIFALIRLTFIIQASLNYSLRHTTHQSLFLPTDRAATFEGKITIDTFFWRFGDLIAAGVVFLGTSIFNFDIYGFIIFNFISAVIWLGIALSIFRPYRQIMFGYNRETVRLERIVAHEEFIQTRESRAER
ncbi:MAG: hypothetical protein V3T39_06015, partial [Gammaproteobacteria bacterium]